MRLSDEDLALVAAMEVGNEGEAARLAELLRAEAALREERLAAVTLGAAAVWYAEHEFEVFPLRPGMKVPLTSHGFKDATSDVEQVRAWWAATPEANIGLPTGRRFDVVDIDGTEGILALFDYRDGGRLPSVLAWAKTPHGFHYVIAPTGIGNRAGVLPSVDFRGLGGYVVAPPSRTADGEYRWIPTRELDPDRLATAAKEPDDDGREAFLDLLRKPMAPPSADLPTEVRPPGSGPSRYGLVALSREAEALARAPEGERNDALNRAAFNLATLVAAGHLDIPTIEHDLRRNALAVGLGEKEIAATLASGIRSGLEKPRYPKTFDPDADTTFLLVPPPEPGEEATNGEPSNAMADWVEVTLPRLDWHALWADEEAEEWLLEPLIPARRLIALYSAPKAGKSLLMLEIAAALATGREVLGVEPERAVRVLYVDFENDPRADLRPRLTAMGYGPDDLDGLAYLSFPTLAALDSEAGGRELLAAVEVYAVELVVIDTVSRSVAGEENDNDTWLRFYRHTGVRLKAAGVACVRLDHSGKDEGKGQRGGSAKSGDVDAVWRLTAISGSTYTLACEAHRLPMTETQFTFERKALPHLHSEVEDTGRMAREDSTVKAIIEALDAAGLPNNTGRPTALEHLAKTGVAHTKRQVEKAVALRKNRTNVYVLPGLEDPS